MERRATQGDAGRIVRRIWRKESICHLPKAISEISICRKPRDPSILQNSSKLADRHGRHIQHSRGTLKQWTKRMAGLYGSARSCHSKSKGSTTEPAFPIISLCERSGTEWYRSLPIQCALPKGQKARKPKDLGPAASSSGWGGNRKSLALLARAPQFQGVYQTLYYQGIDCIWPGTYKRSSVSRAAAASTSWCSKGCTGRSSCGSGNNIKELNMRSNSRMQMLLVASSTDHRWVRWAYPTNPIAFRDSYI